MILFEEDYLKHPEAFPDFQTRNESFLRTARIYKKMGISNCLFHLALHDKELVGVDPHDPDLSDDLIDRIVIECKINPWYFFREVVRLGATASPDAVPLQGNRGNISLYWLFFNHITTMLIQPRQTGKSVSTDCLMVYLFGVATVATDVSLLTKDDNLRVKNVARVKTILEELPYYLRYKTPRDTYNTEKLSLSQLGNNYITNVAQISKKAALNVGRGMTNAINQIDEIAFVSNIETILPALLAASGAARDNAAANGAPYGNIFTTTAGYLNNPDGMYARKIYNECLKWTEKLYDCKDQEDLYATVRKNNPSGKLQVILEFNHRQLGYTDEWLARKIEEAFAEGENAAADYLNIWGEGSMASAIDKNLLKTIKESMRNDPYTTISTQGYITRWYIPEEQVKNNIGNRKVIASLDTSDAVGKDDISMVIRDVSTAEVLGLGMYNETNLISFSLFLVDLIEKYPNLTMIIERRSSGVAIMDNLLNILPVKNIDPFRRLFNWGVSDVTANENDKFFKEVINIPLNRRPTNTYDKHRASFGYATSGAGRSSRDNLYGEAFMASVKYTANVVRDITLINQLTGLIFKNGRIDHGPDNHDDAVIAWLLGYWFLSKAKNKHVYGIPNHIVLTSINEAMIKEQGGMQSIEAKNKQMAIKKEIDNMIEELKRSENDFRKMQLINMIKFRFKSIDTNLIPNYTIESVMEALQLEKRKFTQQAA